MPQELEIQSFGKVKSKVQLGVQHKQHVLRSDRSLYEFILYKLLIFFITQLNISYNLN
jgi:hypothetical protein